MYCTSVDLNIKCYVYSEGEGNVEEISSKFWTEFQKKGVKSIYSDTWNWIIS